ncbi:hypothetical protein JCM33374_g4304 [Metschnikowia sp. JCM 33374]|nr:hypothetical protein JCM33374_g4304 [Metschnikowia sp. JCM 33374]
MANFKESAPESEVKCQELRKRIAEVEESNEISTLALSRTRTSIRRLRLEYAVLLERLEAQVVRLSQEENGGNSEAMPHPNGPLLVDDNLNFKAVKPKVTKARRGRGGVMSAAALRKAARDPNLPKRPTNAYLMFCDREKDKVRAELEKENPGKPVTELTRVLTDLWKGLDDTAKIPYLKLYEEDRERYHREMVIYNKRKHEDANAKSKPSIKIKLGVAHLDPVSQEEPETPSETPDDVNEEEEVEEIEDNGQNGENGDVDDEGEAEDEDLEDEDVDAEVENEENDEDVSSATSRGLKRENSMESLPETGAGDENGREKRLKA